MDNSNIADYYNKTQVHYEQWWKLRDSLSLHYGFWNENTKDFREALANTNIEMMEVAKIKEGDLILDAGCGVGGAAMFLAKVKNAKVKGITLSDKQIKLANEVIQERGLQDQVQVENMDFTQTSFENNTFDVVWACESMCHAEHKEDFLKEAFRVLKPGGRLVVNDYFIISEDQLDPKNLINKWAKSWYMYRPLTAKNYSSIISEVGFKDQGNIDQTNRIKKSAKRMYIASLLGTIPSELYNITHPSVSEEAKHHYKSGFYQYKALRKGLWTYNTFWAIK